MIGWVSGTVIFFQARTATIDVSGVGYEVYCCTGVEKIAVGEHVSLVIYTDVREDQIRLFGFSDRLERSVFLMLKEVKGVGSRHASEIVSTIDARELLRVISLEDSARLQGVKGIGKKTAERILVELRDRVSKLAEVGTDAVDLSQKVEVSINAEDAVLEDAWAALEQLGFSKSDSRNLVEKACQAQSSSPKDAGELVRAALQFV